MVARPARRLHRRAGAGLRRCTRRSATACSAGQCAVWLCEHHMLKARPSIAGGVAAAGPPAPSRPRPESVAVRQPRAAGGRGRPRQRRARPAPTALARDALALARRLPSLDLEAEALQTIGRILIDAGQLAEGLGHLDEAMLSAVEGRLSPYTTGKVHCSMISACEQLGDLRRAAEWTDATTALVGGRTRWRCGRASAGCTTPPCSSCGATGPPPSAKRGRRAPSSTASTSRNVAAGYVEIGEIRRRLGDLDGAEEAFATAEALCGQQSAGLALVRLAQRRIDAATAIITRMLAEQTWNQLARGKLLPAHVQIAVAAGDLDAAADAADELERHRRPSTRARRCRPPRLVRARAAAARPRRRRRGLRHPAARRSRSGSELEVPYEVATARLLLGQACRTCGDEDGAASSLRQRGRHLRPARRRHRRPAPPRPRRRRRAPRRA